MVAEIEGRFDYGKDVRVGHYVIIEDDVVLGNNVKIGNRVTLKAGTRIGDNSIVDDHCITTGACWIGNDVNVRTGAIISRGTIIDDKCFIGPAVVTNHTKNVAYRRDYQEGPRVTYIGFGSVLGSQVGVVAGVFIGHSVTVGAGSLGTKDAMYPGLYLGSPWKWEKSLDDIVARSYLDKEEMKRKVLHLNVYMNGLDTDSFWKKWEAYERNYDSA